MASSKRSQPAWMPPKGSLVENELPSLKLFNSLTMQKELFIPQNGRHVLWYGCGPTVYDMSHMGHARTYISFDILRRILSDYFKYDVTYVMNITDIDDKIIKRARQGHLFEKFVEESVSKSATEVRNDVEEALRRLKSKLAGETDPDKKAMHERELSRIEECYADVNVDKIKLLKTSQDTLADWLDSRLGHTVKENHIFEELPRKFEEEYFTDMDALNIIRPTILTRVSEFVPQIVDFVQKILDNGYAYEAMGSVYFDVNKFDAAEEHFYAKLVPTAVGDEAMLHEGEGDLSISSDRLGEKRSSKDFALWKNSKPGEPAWPSPWGMGRPGWHIECSVMASSECGESMDIHSGGIDLKFPHHDNEMAQSEAYYGNSHWVRYFLHSGHLTIKGCKMSKSLKNFITIRDALAQYSSRQLRLAFLLHSWKDTLDYSDETMLEAASFEKLFADFFFRAKHYRNCSSMKANDEKAKNLRTKLEETYNLVNTALLDSIDTRSAMSALQNLIGECNNYIKDCQSVKGVVNGTLLGEAAAYISNLLNIFGAVTLANGAKLPPNHIGFEPLVLGNPNELYTVMNKFVEDVRLLGKEKVTALCDDLSLEKLTKCMDWVDAMGEDEAQPILEEVASIREKVRAAARQSKIFNILGLCDTLRDDCLPALGIRLEDPQSDEVPLIGLADNQWLKAERQERLAKEEEKRIKAEKARVEKERLAAEREAKNRIPPSELFRGESHLYSAFDAHGLPTHDASGQELSKAQVKKLTKMMEQQEKRYNEWLKQKNKLQVDS